ncbi:ATP-dependent 6-phosphofructokinase [Salinimonas sp. HHU 13199]|uniref:6-phosphofructokinase n=1 Tax=Salinimonas profundi TaxID=2729140 RepID=A0ABR8LHG8_9ALTE|nr:ATP-dependent 6-phosphofructokinase [Salinimonas profundi]MBD3584541.1 ATP-dependent 6-phosphofructokinase [Salinimonas profundi]
MTKHIAILTSGGDAPGMNACIRAIVIAADRLGYQISGYLRGYNGLLDDQRITLTCERMHNLLQQGGTILHSARCKAFTTEQGLKKAADNLTKSNVDTLFVIGGDGSFRGAHALGQIWEGQIIGLPGTIDNDVAGTDATIGYYTAIETAVSSIDKVRDTADAFDRVFMVEVMGRHAGFLALSAALASASDYVILPERFSNEADTLTQICTQIQQRQAKRGPVSYVIVLAENVWPGGINDLCVRLASQSNMEVKPVILGHVQRGGSPVSQDRLLAVQLGTYAVTLVETSTSGVMVGTYEDKAVTVPLPQTWEDAKPLPDDAVTTMMTLMNERYR